MTATRRDVFAAFLRLLIVDMAIASGGFPRVHRLIRRVAVRRRGPPVDELGTITAINDAVNRAAVWYPRAVQCVPRSAAATWLLRRRGVAAVTVIGVRRMPFYAHAWVEVDGRVVNDAPAVQARYPAIDRWAPIEAAR